MGRELVYLSIAAMETAVCVVRGMTLADADPPSTPLSERVVRYAFSHLRDFPSWSFQCSVWSPC